MLQLQRGEKEFGTNSGAKKKEIKPSRSRLFHNLSQVCMCQANCDFFTSTKQRKSTLFLYNMIPSTFTNPITYCYI